MKEDKITVVRVDPKFYDIETVYSAVKPFLKNYSIKIDGKDNQIKVEFQPLQPSKIENIDDEFNNQLIREKIMIDNKENHKTNQYGEN